MSGDSVMWMEKLSYGVLRVLTPLGPRYLNPSFAQRLYLLWIFRNFETLPVKVLSPRQQRWIDAICARHGSGAQWADGYSVARDLGTASAGGAATAVRTKCPRSRVAVRRRLSAAFL